MGKTNISLKTFVEFNTVFDGDPESIDVYLKGASRTKVIEAAILFLSFGQNNSKFASQLSFLEMFFSEANNDLANQIYDKLKKNSRDDLPIVNPLAALTLLEYAFDNLDENITQEPKEVEANIFRAIVTINTAIGIKQVEGMDSVKSFANEHDLPLYFLCLSFSNSELLNYDKNELIVAQILKSVYFFRFLKSNSKTQAHLNKFLELFKTSCWEEFVKRLFVTVNAAYKGPNDIHTDIQIVDDKDKGITTSLIDNLSVNDLTVIKDDDFKNVRNKPFYRVGPNIYRIIFALFLYEKLHKGVYFKIAEINATFHPPTKISNFRSFYCDEFSEKFLLYNTLNYIYQGKTYKVLSGETIKKKWKVDAEPDFYVRNGKYTFIFESKDVLVDASVKSSMDAKAYFNEFKKKFYLDDSNGKIQNKAVMQFIVNIKKMLSNIIPFDNNYNINKIHIYPVLVLHDHQFNVLGLNNLVNTWFNIELIKLTNNGYDVSRIKPIVIVNIDSLLMYQETLKSSPSLFKGALDGYIKATNLTSGKPFRSIAHAESRVKETLQPFSSFLHDFLVNKGTIKSPKMLKEFAQELF